ncbi:MAG: pyruvate dehydrogenase complex dihydrolipoamide acetyltransferase [Rhodobacterales bacterium]|jgi:pyruvate dehydrogenase E2 component (dihydrolipoamide acetyltransferase)|tara:strand:+ start:3749 stop:5041 length:1293 start_codon:yes stop_codon:yes gene_type:complete
MATEILMPALSPTMEEGVIVKWFIKEGDKVSAGDLLAEIETDKATMELEAIDDGIVGELIYKEGVESIKINTPIAIIYELGEEGVEDKKVKSLKSQTDTKDNITIPMKNTLASQRIEDKKEKYLNHEKPETKGPRIASSPLAKRIAAENDIDLSTVKGSGPRGRVIKTDVESTIASLSSSLPRKNLTLDHSTKSHTDRDFEKIPVDGLRKIIASRLTEAKSTVPHFYLRQSINVDNLLRVRSIINLDQESHGIKLSINDFIIKASALALKQIPDANVIWANDHLKKFNTSDISVAVTVEGGLMTPVIFDAETKSLSKISNEMKSLSTRAKERKLTPNEYQGGSFSISNLGMYEIEDFDAIINPPQSAILAVGQAIKKPIVNQSGTELSIATIMKVTLSVDHRAIDGALGSELLSQIRHNLENPELMLALN